jgi:hypothetical protein
VIARFEIATVVVTVGPLARSWKLVARSSNLEAGSYFLIPECHASKLNETPPLRTRLAALASC